MDNLKASISDWISGKVDVVGFAPVDRFADAPEAHHPSRICKDARTVVVFGMSIPWGVLSSPDYNLYLLHRSYHTLYPELDSVAINLAKLIEAEGYPAVQIPGYAPLVFHGTEAWGILSLKHAAVCAGLGAFGRSDLVYHPRYGALLRWGAVVTGAEIPGGELIGEEPCPPKCRACEEACPSGALKDGKFDKLACQAYSVTHAIYPIAIRDEAGLKNLEKIINTAGYNYWLKCDECLKVCPLNRMKST